MCGEPRRRFLRQVCGGAPGARLRHYPGPVSYTHLDGATVNVCDLLEKGILSKCEYGYKVLGNGTLTKKLIVRASAFSASAKEKIVAAGGKYEVV